MGDKISESLERQGGGGQGPPNKQRQQNEGATPQVIHVIPVIPVIPVFPTHPPLSIRPKRRVPAYDERKEKIAVVDEEGVLEKAPRRAAHGLGCGLYPPAAEEVAKVEGEGGRHEGGRARRRRRRCALPNCVKRGSSRINRGRGRGAPLALAAALVAVAPAAAAVAPKTASPPWRALATAGQPADTDPAHNRARIGGAGRVGRGPPRPPAAAAAVTAMPITVVATRGLVKAGRLLPLLLLPLPLLLPLRLLRLRLRLRLRLPPLLLRGLLLLLLLLRRRGALLRPPRLRQRRGTTDGVLPVPRACTRPRVAAPEGRADVLIPISAGRILSRHMLPQFETAIGAAAPGRQGLEGSGRRGGGPLLPALPLCLLLRALPGLHRGDRLQVGLQAGSLALPLLRLLLQTGLLLGSQPLLFS